MTTKSISPPMQPSRRYRLLLMIIGMLSLAWVWHDFNGLWRLSLALGIVMTLGYAFYQHSRLNRQRIAQLRITATGQIYIRTAITNWQPLVWQQAYISRFFITITWLDAQQKRRHDVIFPSMLPTADYRRLCMALRTM